MTLPTLPFSASDRSEVGEKENARPATFAAHKAQILSPAEDDPTILTRKVLWTLPS
jgi:hypothetical protein